MSSSSSYNYIAAVVGVVIVVVVTTGELRYDRLNGTRKIGPSYAKSVVYIWRILDMHRTGTKHIILHMQKSVVQWSVISKFTCIRIIIIIVVVVIITVISFSIFIVVVIIVVVIMMIIIIIIILIYNNCDCYFQAWAAGQGCRCSTAWRLSSPRKRRRWSRRSYWRKGPPRRLRRSYAPEPNRYRRRPQSDLNNSSSTWPMCWAFKCSSQTSPK